MWSQTKFTTLLGINYPIVQGAFGGGLSSVALTATVSNAGGMGSFGAQPYTAEEIIATTEAIKQRTTKPFAINLWVSDHDVAANNYSDADYEKLKTLFQPYFNEAGIAMPSKPVSTGAHFADQVEGLLKAKPPVFSFVFGIPSAEILKECRKAGIITIGTATTLDEALAIQEAGVDAVVVTGMEAGGHRVSFLRPAEDSLTGIFSLIQQVRAKVKIPIIAAGGIVDAKGIAAAMMLGADAAQIGSAFLATDESNATAPHRAALFSDKANHTVLTKAFSGRLARGMESRIATDLKKAEFAPYPLQSQFMGALRKAFAAAGKDDYITFWAGQSAGLIKHHSAEALMRELVNDANDLFAATRQ